MSVPPPFRPDPACPDALVLAAYLDQTLDARERPTVEAHLAGCEACRDVVASVISYQSVSGHEPVPAAPPVVVPAAAGQAPSPLMWFVATVAAAALAMAIVWPLNEWRHASTAAAIIAPLQGERLLGDGQLSGQTHAEPLGPQRGPETTRVSPVARAAAAEAEVVLADSSRPGDLAAVGRARLYVGNFDGAVAALERAVAEAPRPEWHNDLSVAYLQRASRNSGNANEDLRRALASAQAALAADSTHREAKYNLALTLQALGETDRAIQTWEAFLADDATSPWATAARKHLSRLTASR